MLCVFLIILVNIRESINGVSSQSCITFFLRSYMFNVKLLFFLHFKPTVLMWNIAQKDLKTYGSLSTGLKALFTEVSYVPTLLKVNICCHASESQVS